MIKLLKTIHDRLETYSGRKVFFLFLSIFVLFLSLGLYIGYLNNLKLKQNELELQKQIVQETPVSTLYEGKIEYINPGYYPNDKISYTLVDSAGKRIILLKSKDQKLSIAENLFVKVKGTLVKTKDGKEDVLNVSEVIIKNVSN